MNFIPDDVWHVIAETLKTYKGIEVTAAMKRAVEAHCEIHVFPGGCFVLRGNELDCFVVKERRGKWMTRGLLDRVIGGAFRRFGTVTCRIHKNNLPSITTAQRLGFEVVREGEIVEMELRKWKLSAES